MRSTLRRLRYLLSHRSRAVELLEELEFHLAMSQQRLEQSVMDAADAVYASRRVLGTTTLAREEARGTWTWPSIEQVWGDARHGARMLRAHPTFAATAILTLAVGIGATTTVMSVVDAELWKPMPFPEADRLVGLRRHLDRSAHSDVCVPHASRRDGIGRAPSRSPRHSRGSGGGAERRIEGFT